MSTPPGAVTAVSWTELCPWLLLVRAARAALLVRMIVLAAAGVWLTQAGWRVVEEAMLYDAQPRLIRLTVSPTARQLDAWPTPMAALRFDEVNQHPWAGPVVRGWAWAIQPLVRLTEARGVRAVTALVACGAWAIAVWALIGGAMARISALYLTRGELLGPIAALKSAAGSWVSTVAAPTFCFGVIAVFAVLLLIAGFLMRVHVLAFLAGVMWPVALAIGLAIAVFAIGLAVGWPFMWSTIAAERTDAFDGVSHAYAYVYQRPLHLAFFVVVATALGLLAQAAVDLIVSGASRATAAATARGLGEYADAVLTDDPLPAGEHRSVIAAAGGKMLRFWTAGLESLAASFPLAYLFPAAMGMYLLQRRLIDATELGEVALDQTPVEPGLPPLVRHAAPGEPAVPSPATTRADAPPPGDGAAAATAAELRGGSA
jgi:hypothetical protein